ncbi:MAG: DNA-binding response regulator, partial [Acidimicrobiia bacterium]
MTEDLQKLGRESYRKNAWLDAYIQLSAADKESALEPPDLELLAISAHMTGKEQEALDIQEQAHHAFFEQGDVERASRNAVWLGMNLMQMGEFARGGGWIATATRLIQDPWRDCVEQGWVLLPNGVMAFGQGENDTALEVFGQALAIGERFGDSSLIALARHGQGRALIKKGEVDKGVSLLDEAMVQVMSKNVYPVAVGIIYCSVIDACFEVFDLRRAQEWTTALSKWAEPQPDLIPFRGQCAVFRADLMQLHGEWSEALNQASSAAKRLREPPPHEGAGAAIYK